jgi:hypothetical protein
MKNSEAQHNQTEFTGLKWSLLWLILFVDHNFNESLPVPLKEIIIRTEGGYKVEINH